MTMFNHLHSHIKSAALAIVILLGVLILLALAGGGLLVNELDEFCTKAYGWAFDM